MLVKRKKQIKDTPPPCGRAGPSGPAVLHRL